jgi:FkbM family methyltransferase
MPKLNNALDVLRRKTPLPFKRFLRRLRDFYQWDDYAQQSWAQEGEDMILRKIFGLKKSGFYIDVGAHHPKRFSNTYLFYRLGWRGINIDAMPGSMNDFRKHRSRDINLEIGVGEKEAILDYYMFNETALNGFSKVLSTQRNSQINTYKIIKTIPVRVLPLATIIEKYIDPAQEIDFLSVDVEGLDLGVLKSNDWSIYRPSYVLAEIISGSLNTLDQNEVTQFMKSQGYNIYAKCANTVFFSK